MRHACTYALIRFRPDPEADEWLNVGVALLCRNPFYFGYQLPLYASPRIQAWRPDIWDETYSMYESHAQAFHEGLRHIELAPNANVAAHRFEELIRPRESPLFFGPARAVLTEDAAAELLNLFSRYVPGGENSAVVNT